ncbi:SDR family oxidoreductase [Marinivivus vitaminiproducens]|uniref:SDR family oxidoreductase n=1 Tax=Marinivivus vitaminiproducens TaxID=3035935 RepID=UPI0027A768E1|nr:SDR family NAD(P)-dependent oxidoreductase [Geminicoccaceae bacterium SCSIO 64248]
MLPPQGRVVLVSGAARGIGRAIAETLHAKGYTVSLGARNQDALAEVTAGFDRDRTLTAVYDALDKATHKAWVDATLQRFGRIDALVNNAGVSLPVGIMDDDEEALDRTWAVNVKAPLSMIRLCLPHLKASGSGRVVNVSSLSGKRVRIDNVAYCTSKFAVTALTHGIRQAAWQDGVRATALCPGYVRTDMTADVTKVAREDMIDPADLAELAATVIALPNTASVAEMLVNPGWEAML